MTDKDKEKVLNACAALAEVSGYHLYEILDGLLDGYIFTPEKIKEIREFAKTY